MKIRLLAVGKMKNQPLRLLAEDYADRVRRFARLELVEIPDGRARDPAARLREEGQALARILGRAEDKKFSHAVLWDERGDEMDTAVFSKWLEQALRRSPVLDFVIGSSHGVDAGLQNRIPQRLRLSAFTLTHEWARALALEQIYRAFCVQRGLPYHQG